MPLTDEWIKNMWSVCVCLHAYICTHTCAHTHTHTPEYYSVIKKNETWQLAATWMDLDIIILSKVSQTEKEKYCMPSFICGI